MIGIEAAAPEGLPPLVTEALTSKEDKKEQSQLPQVSPPGERPPLALPPPLPESIRRGDPPPSLPHNLPAPEALREHFLLLRRFLELPPERLAQIRETIERIEKMEPRRKATMLAKIREVQAPPTSASPQEKNATATSLTADSLPALLESLSPEQRQQVESLAAGFSVEQKAAFYQGLLLRVELSLEQAQPAAKAGETEDSGSIGEAAASR